MGGPNAKKAAATKAAVKVHTGGNEIRRNGGPYQSKASGALATMRKLWLSSTSVPAFIAEVRAKAAWANTMPAIALDEVITTATVTAAIILSICLSASVRRRTKPRRSPWRED